MTFWNIISPTYKQFQYFTYLTQQEWIHLFPTEQKKMMEVQKISSSWFYMVAANVYIFALLEFNTPYVHRKF